MSGRTEGDKVFINIDSRTFLEIGYDEAMEFSRMLANLSKQAEEYSKADKIISDHAFCIRAGIPAGLSSGKMAMHAANEAAWDTTLRRQLPGGIKSKSIVGKPTIIQEHQCSKS